MITDYKNHVRSRTRSAATVRARDHYIDKLAAALDVETATAPQIETWLHSHGWAPTSINSALASVRHFYRWAVRYGYLDSDPTLYMPRVREPRKMGRIASDQTIARAVMRVPVDTRAMILLGAECGLRRSEIAKVHRNDIEGEWLYVIGKAATSGSLRCRPSCSSCSSCSPPEASSSPRRTAPAT